VRRRSPGGGALNTLNTLNTPTPNMHPWFIRRDMPTAKRRLFCFPYAGGNAAAYADWQEKIGPGVEICAVQLPGRATRFCEPASTSMHELVTQVTAAMAGLPPLPFAYFGHSMGALLAFETARYGVARGLPAPGHLFASGCAAPQSRDPSKSRHTLDDDAFIAHLSTYEGTPPAVLAHRELMELVLPTIRADFSLVDTYTYLPGEPIPTPISVLCGTDDPCIRADQYAAWAQETSLSCTTHRFAGNHFFLHTDTDAVIAHLRHTLLD